ncbi:MAG: CRISPR-associated endonuclease Cas2 [Deltaproteobacteria bacterium]|nr:CRISPR-associated endonuclease Cas2 [Deltaproteobacteria bacterium]
MSCYIISYDLRNQRDYQSLHDAIKGLGKWAKILESVWAVVSNKSAAKIKEELLKVMDNDDRVFIVKSGVESSWKNVICKSSWLQDNL